MIIPDDVIRRALENVYFIWGSGKTTAANALAERHGFYVYRTDESRSRHFHNADPNGQPAMCRDVPDFWALEPEDALARETRLYGVKQIIRDSSSSVETVVNMIEQYWGLRS